ncbi:MAG: pilus assembly protein [Chromatiaceae bacterium]|nr:pilus assembly protein [Chromatiaceae bacterium]
MTTRNTLTLGALAATLTLIALPVLAGPGGWNARSGMDVEAPIERMAERLDLSSAQQEDLRKLMDENRARHEALRGEFRDKVDALLTPEQRAQRDSMVEQRIERRLARLDRRLDLSDQQTKAIKAVFEARQQDPALSRAEVRARIEAVLTEEQREQLKQRPERPRRNDF